MADQPLKGVRVLEMAQAIAGPFAARTLADMGAEVIKVEQPGVGDMSRRIGPHFLGGESAYYLNFNRNKQSVTIDLRQAQGQEVFQRLVAVSVKMNLIISILIQHQACHGSPALIGTLSTQSE